MNAELHGTCHSIAVANDLNVLNIKRSSFLDPSLKLQVADKVAAGDDILFLGNDVAETCQKDAYQLILHGILPCGSKTTVTINGIDPHVDLRLAAGETDESAASRISNIATLSSTDTLEVRITRISYETGRDFLYYDDCEHRYARVHFQSLKERKAFMETCRSKKLKTYSNDNTSYHRVVSRGYEINLSGWNVLRQYELEHGSKSKAAYTFLIDVNDIGTIADDAELATIAAAQRFDPGLVKYENLILCSFDIEMIPENPAHFPDADKHPKDSIFMICMTYHFVKRPEALLSVCLTLKETDAMEDMLMVHCQTEKCLLEAFARFMAYMQPDFITEYNGGGFDWRNIITKALQTNALSSFLTDMSIMRLLRWETTRSMLGRYHRECRIKINGATADSRCKGFHMQGFVSFDLLVVARQLFPNADSHKLNEILRMCNLGGKDDLDVQEMFRIYREGASEEMKVVAHYCYIDTFKLQQLQLKKNVIQDRREVATLSYTSLYDNFQYAGGIRMRNLLMNRGAKLGYFFDTAYRPEISDPDAKFPGAYVVPPIKGIVKPMMRLDEFLSLDRMETDEQVLRDGYAYIADHFDAVYGPGECVDAPEAIRAYIAYAKRSQNQYPVSGLDYASLYPSLIMTYNISPEKLIIDEAYATELANRGVQLQYVTFPFSGEQLRAWFVRHNNVEADYSICGKLLIELFDRRAALKKVLKHYSEAIYEMEQEMKPYVQRNAMSEYPRLAEYNDAVFDYASCDSKQKAVKVFMNTLYGEMGNVLSCICAVQVAGSVTAMGRYNLKLAKAFVESELQMKTYYGDSVVGDTPIMIKRVINGVETAELLPIEKLDTRYERYVGGKECIDYRNESVYVMTDDGYSKIVKVIRHRTKKQLYRVTTRAGSVIVTEDHSLLSKDKTKVKPSECHVGTELLHWDAPMHAGPVAVRHVEVSGQLNAQSTYLALLAQGSNVYVDVCGTDTYRFTIADLSFERTPTAITSIVAMGHCDGYVYDLETESHHFAAGVGRMVVHNTDSLYVSCHPSHFADHDREYFTGKIDKVAYGTKLVETTFEQIEVAKHAVNAHLISDNGSAFLRMAYEEVLYPVAFLSKKKYYGVPHEENVDFYPRKLFLRGLEIVKRGASGVLKDVISEVLREAMDLRNTDDIISIMKRAISRVFSTNWPVEAFAKAKVYNPDKQNVAVQTMIRRYQAMQYPAIPEPNVRFKSVICKYYPWTYDIEGRQTKHSIGDRMELVQRVLDENLEVDLEYYFDNELTGQFARLITFCDEFADAASAVQAVDVTGMTEAEAEAAIKEHYTRTEDALFKAAKKYIGELAKHYSKAYVNKGSLFSNTWRETGKYIVKHPHVFAKHLSEPQAIVLGMFAHATDINQHLLSWASRHVNGRYRIVVDLPMVKVIESNLKPAVRYIQRNRLESAVANCQRRWQERVVQHIRDEYSYDQICKLNLPFETVWDVLSEEEMQLILSDPELFPAIDADHAMAIIDLVAQAIAKSVPVDSLAILRD